jgi:hypothetical protein
VKSLLGQEVNEVCRDILWRLEETGQIYIVGHDIPISVSKGLYEILDAKRRAEARRRGIVEVQYEWEDFFWDMIVMRS